MNSERQLDTSRLKVRVPRKNLRKPARIKPISTQLISCDVFFTAGSYYGPVGLGVSMPVASDTNVPLSDSLHALILGVVEHQIQFIENWLQNELDITPSLQDLDVNSEVLSIKDEENGTQITLHLPAQYWNLIPVFPSQSFPDTWSLSWKNYIGNVTLSKLSMKLEEADTISDGSLILIPESFSEQWDANLLIPKLSILLPGHYNSTLSNWTLSGGFEVISSEPVVTMSENIVQGDKYAENKGLDKDVHGVITYSLDVPANTMVPSIDHQTLAGNMVSTHRECRLALSNGKVHTGYIAPVASGYALFVTGASIL